MTDQDRFKVGDRVRFVKNTLDEVFVVSHVREHGSVELEEFDGSFNHNDLVKVDAEPKQQKQCRDILKSWSGESAFPTWNMSVWGRTDSA